MSLTTSIDDITALKEALSQAHQSRDDAIGHSKSLASQLLLARTERDLLKEQLNKLMRRDFAAKSEATIQHQKDMFFNESEALDVHAQPAAQEEPDSANDEDADSVDVPAHKRAKRGRKPLDPALPRHVVGHELPESERMCPHDGTPLKEIGVEASEQLDIIPQQVRVIRHERVKYACPCCDGSLRLAAKPAQFIPKGLFSEGLLAWALPPSTAMACRCTATPHCWDALAGVTSRAKPWRPASCGWARRCNPSSTCCATICWSRH